ncbi:hspD [Symbiodinium pilosum]|uniref:HspD protein n=1 Tax=Symbiodinium pilosum TaxID=2952 RepID=A0A812VL78_SYMPI|nr:hspD [Symbiodinium pilosum]
MIPSRRQAQRGHSSPILRSLVGGFLVYFAGPAAFSALTSRRPSTLHGGHRQFSLARRAESAETATATEVADGEEFEFQAEVGRVMDIIINSLYSNKDVFLRELVSNAADACDKKRFLALTESDAPPEPMKLRINTNKDDRLLIIEDNGVGMLKDELKENLGRIARSGTANFVKELGSGEADVSLIGQFGVGFYSAFLVANQVDVYSKSFKKESEGKIWKWSSSGHSYSIKEAEETDLFGEQSGTKIVLHLREEAQEYLDTGKLSDLLKKYSEFITFPIELYNEKVQYDQVPDESAPPPKEGEKQKMKSVPRSVYEWDIMNKMKPIWLRNPDVVNQSEYTEFYKTTFKAFDEPMTVTHFKVEGQIEFRALVFIPSTMPFELTRDMFSPEGRAMRLYVKRVFINDKFEDLVPRWLTFARGVVDSEDLPLNVGREILQKSRTLKIIRKRVVRKVLDTIDDLRENDPNKFESFWTSYGKYFKVGLVEDLDYKDELKRFVRFWSSKSGDNQTSLDEYISRMKEGQDKIYFVTGEGRRAAEIAPAMEKMRLKDYEVLYMVDPLDEICSQSIVDYEGKKLVDINKAGLDLDKSEDEKKEMEETTKEFEALATWLKKQLGERVQKVQISDRLVESPATLVQGEWGMSPMMQRYMKSQTTSSASDSAFAIGSRNQAILEINPSHNVVKALKNNMETKPDAVETEDMVMMLYETAALIGGYTIEDPGDFAKRVTKLMEMQAEGAGAGTQDAEVVA